ncbi:MAG: D-2-hydroxyacid dehydrogenase family protein [Alphaproteobacteria bacterium]
MPKMKIAVLDDYQGVVRDVSDWSVLEDRAVITVFKDHLFEEDAIVDRLGDFDIIVVMRERTPFPKSLISRLPNLKLLVTGNMRNLGIDMDAAKACGIPVCGTEAIGYSAAEMTWALLMSTMRRIPQQVQAVREGDWQLGLGNVLTGKTLGIIGLGRQGSYMVRYAQAFDMDVVAWSKNLTLERCEEKGVRFADSLEALLGQSDVVSINTILSDRTRGLIGAKELQWMKQGAYLINASRGPIVKEQPLIDAVNSGHLAGAGLDVFDIEPLPVDHPYRSNDNIVATPHLGYVCHEGYKVFFDQGIEDIDAWLKGEPIRVINP